MKRKNKYSLTFEHVNGSQIKVKSEKQKIKELYEATDVHMKETRMNLLSMLVDFRTGVVKKIPRGEQIVNALIFDITKQLPQNENYKLPSERNIYEGVSSKYLDSNVKKTNHNESFLSQNLDSSQWVGESSLEKSALGQKLKSIWQGSDDTLRNKEERQPNFINKGKEQQSKSTDRATNSIPDEDSKELIK